MADQTATVAAGPRDDAAAVRPLTTLIPLIQREIDLGNAAGLEHYRRAGEMLLEAKAQLVHGEFTEWVRRHFTLTMRTAQKYMQLVAVQKRTAFRFSSLREAIASSRPIPPPPIDLDRLTQDRHQHAREQHDRRALALAVVESGYKVQGHKLHPDRGGDTAAMARLNAVRDVLKRLVGQAPW